MKKISAAALLLLAASLCWWSLPLEAQGNILKVVGLRSTGTIQSVDATHDGSDNMTMSPPTLPPTGPVTSGVAGSCLSTRQYRFYKAWANQSGFTTLGPTSTPDFTPSVTNRRTTITFADEAPPADATAVALFHSSSNDSHATKRFCGVSLNSSVVAVGTTTFDCPCQGTTNQTGGTTGTLTRIKLGFQGEIRGAQEDPVNAHKAATVDKNRLLLSGTLPQWSSDSGATYGRISAIGPRVKTVCAAGCDHTTLTAALANITDASVTNPYFIDYDGIETTPLALKSWITIGGKSPEVSKIGNVTVAADVTGLVLQNLTVGGTHTIPINLGAGVPGTRTIMRVDNVVCGDPASAIDCLFDPTSGGSHDFVFNQVTFRSRWDTVILGPGSRWWDFNCKWELSTPVGGNNVPNGWTWEQTQMLGVEVRSYNADFDVTLPVNDAKFTGLHVVEASGTPPAGTIVELHQPSFNVRVTAGAWTGTATCVNIDVVQPSSFQSRVSVYDMDCKMTAPAGGSGVLTGIKTVLDATDHATWKAMFHGGRISLTGAGTRNDIDNGETSAGFLSVSGMQTGGVFAGAGVGVIGAVQTHRGAFDTLLQIPPEADLAADTCTIGEVKVDSGGATRELCWGYNNGGTCRWACVSATIANGPTN